MKKNLFLTLMLAVLCTVTAWAEFAPESGKKYALREKTTGMYLDIQTLGITDPNATSNNISLNTKPCIIFFESTESGNWKIKNINGGYLYHLDDDGSGLIWNPQIGTKGEVKEWVITETEANVITIARAEGNYLFELNYISADNLTPASPLYCSSKTGLEFELVDYAATGCDELIYTLQSPIGTYLQLDTSMVNADTRTKFSSAKHYFNLVPQGDRNYKIENNGNYVAYNVLLEEWGVNTWGTGANDGEKNAVWLISEFDDDGLALISREMENWYQGQYYGTQTVYLGSNFSTGAGGYIYANVGADCNRWYFEGTTDYPTTATLNDGKYKFTSGEISYALPFNKLRFTLIESTAQYENTAFNRCDFESFVLLDKDGKTIADADDFNWNTDASAHDWFEIDLHGIDLGGEFSFSFVTENENMNAKAFRIDAYHRSDVYPLVIEGYPDDVEVTVTYDGQPVQPGAEFSISAINTELFRATRIDGYTWSVVIDRENKKIIIRYTPATIVDDELDAVDALVNRIGGAGTAEKFKFVLDPSMNSVNEVFEISGEDGKILIKGTTISAITTGIGWYLQNYAHINISWNSLNEKGEGVAYADLSGITAPTATERRTCDAKYRYFLNYCTFGYSMSTWTWKRWQQEIDWMALHGINMPLQIVGLEEVWRTFLTMKDENGAYKYGYDNEDAKNFVAGPAFTAWWGMNNLEGWGGTKAGVLNGGVWDGAGGVQDDAWYARQKQLAQQICERQRQLGMQPVLPGFSGMVPHDFQNESGYITRENGGYWAGGFQRPMILSIENEDYAAIAADYYACLKEVMGESQYYSMDPFHEGGGTGTVNDYQYLYNAMEAANPGSQWVIQQWQWYPHQKLSLTAVPAGRLIVLDLFSDGSPAFNAYNGYAPHEAVFCAIPNFGGRSGLMGRLNNLTDNYFNYKATYPSIKGIGAAPEAIEQTPVTYDLLFQLPWMGSKPNVKEWVKNYATARYGVANAELQAAWELLRQGPLNYGADGIQGPVEDVWAARPNLEAKAASSWGSTLSRGHNIPAPELTYTKERQQMLIQATYKLLSQNSAVSGAVNQSNYNYDVVELGGAVMADYAHYLLLGIKAAKEAAGDTFATDPVYIARRDAFLALIEEVDAFKGTNLNFRLGKWTQEARAAAGEIKGASSATADWYEFNNARTLITTWSSPGTDLNDYSYRSWQGMMKDYYLPRWQAYFNSGCNDNLDYRFFEWNWAHGLVHAVGQTAVSKDRLVSGQPGYSYSATPVGDAVELANGLLAKYMIPVSDGYSTYYAHRHIANDLTSIVTIYTKKGETINLAPYFGELSGATVTGDFIEGEVTSLNSVPVKSTATDDSYTGTVKLADGTSFTFIVSLEPAYNGVYRLKAMTCGDAGAQPLTNPGNLFIAYNTDATDLFGSVGYKLVANGTYSSSAVADEYFTIAPLGNGYSLQAQGLYVKAPQDLASWGHIMCSENSIDAGVYLFDEVDGENLVVLHNDTGDNIWANSYLNVWDKNILGNESSSRYSKFAIEQVTTYPLTFPANGEAVVCLPFNIVLPEGVVAYDVIDVDDAGRYEIALLAASGEKVMAGTPVILRGEKGAACELGVTVDNSGAKGALTGSLLRGNFIKQQLNVDNAISKYTFNAENASFNLLAASTEIAGNSVWMELDRRIESPVTRNYKGYLAEMIEKMQALTDVVIAYNRVELSLQTTEGPYYIWSNATDAGSDISYLLDNKPATHFHSNWQSTTAPADGLDHHLTVELGEGNELTYFAFDYKARAQVDGEGELGDYPTIIKVQGSNDGENYVDIAIVNPHNASGQAIKNGVEWTSGMLGNDQSYKYLRFMVTATTTNREKDGHIYWHMAEFNLYKMVPTENVRPYLASGGLTSEHIHRAKEALAVAENVYENGTTDSDFDTAAENLEQEYNALLALLKNVLPVELTIDEANPRLYKIIIKRANDDSKVLSFDEPTSDKVKVVDNGANKSYQAWYFMPGDNGILIKPFNGNGKVLSVDNKDNGQSKANIAAADINKFQEWGFTKSTQSGCTDYFYIKLVGDGSAGTFSHNGGFSATSYMGIWSGGFNTSDGGSLFKFIDAEFSNENARYYQLSDVVDTMLEPKSDPGYPSEGYDDYAAAYTTAKALQYSGNANSSASCYEAYVELQPAYQVWKSATGEIFKPVHGAVYRIRNYIKNSSEHNHYLVNDGTQIGLPTTVAGDNTAALWVCLEENGKYKFVSASGAAAFGWNHTMKETAEGMLKETPTSFAMGKGVEFGTVTLADVVDNTNYCMSLTGKEWKDLGSVLFNYSTGGAYNSSSNENNQWSTDWYLETVEDANVVYDRTMVAGHHWGTLYLPYAVEVPENLTAYYATTVDKEKKVIDLYNVGEVIPAYTAVVFNRADDSATETFSFCQTAENATTTASGNLLAGRIMTSAVGGDGDNNNYYLLMNASKGEAFYWVFKEFSADATIANGHAGTHNGKYIKCEGNKAFLALPAGTTNPAALSFRYGGDTTDIEEVKGENGKVKTIYDLQGRKLSEITEPGIYIVNGNKVLVK